MSRGEDRAEGEERRRLDEAVLRIREESRVRRQRRMAARSYSRCGLAAVALLAMVAAAGEHQEQRQRAAETAQEAEKAPLAATMTERVYRGRGYECSLPILDEVKQRPQRRHTEYRRSRSVVSGANDAPGDLSKQALVGGMNAVKPVVRACYERYGVPGMAMVNVTIGPAGRVTAAQVTGTFSGTPTGICVERAVRSASFPRSDGLMFPYPFILR